MSATLRGIEGPLSSTARIARYGVPAVIGIFYLTASLAFDFTSEGTMAMASLVKYGFSSPLGAGSPSPLWEFILTVGRMFRLDPLLSAKVLSLVFSCLAILVCYLVANEILRDYVMAFCVALILAMQGWFLQIAPSGSALGAAMALVLAVVFFMLRNDYVVATFILGLCTLIFWQAVFLLVPLCADIGINSINKRRALKVMLVAGLAYGGALLPWVVFSWINARDMIPVMLGFSELPALTAVGTLTLALPGSCAVVGLALAASGAKHERRSAGVGPHLFMIFLFILGTVLHLDVWYAGIPLVLAYGFLGLTRVWERLGRGNPGYTVSIVLTGVLLIGAQSSFYTENKPSMADAIAQMRELRTAGEWVGMNSLTGQDICAEHPAVIGYYAERPVTSVAQSSGSHCDLMVSSRTEISGYEMAFSPKASPDEVPVQRFAVWRKR